MNSIPDLTDQVKWSTDDHCGFGSFGDIYKGDWNGKPVAIKKLRYFSNELDEKQKKIRKRMKRELQILHKLHHPNIIKLEGKIFHKNHEMYSMVFPWMEEGELIQYLLEKRKGASLNQRLDILYPLSKGLEYLHTRNPPIVHGDLSTGNILFDKNGVPYLSDFGMATVLVDRETYQTSTMADNLLWCPPEYRSNESILVLKPTREGDIYSFGSIMFTVLSGKLPYHYYTTKAQLRKEVIIQGKWPKRDEKILDPHWELIRHCWMKKPIDRPKIQTVVDSIKGFRQRDYSEFNNRFGVDENVSRLHASPSFDPDKFTAHVMLLIGFPKGTTHMELVSFIHRQHPRNGSQKSESDNAPIDDNTVMQETCYCMRCPTSVFLTCKSKAYAAYGSEDLLRASILECSEETWDHRGTKGLKIICEGYIEQDGKDTLKHERGTGVFIRWISRVPYCVPHRKRRAFLMRSRDTEFQLPIRTWRTQRQNEILLNQAFNTGTEVYLIFCARQAREIFGIARMEDAIPITAPQPPGPPPEGPENGPELGSPFPISWCGAEDLQQNPQHIPFDTLLTDEDPSLREGMAMIKGGRDGIELARDFLESLRARGCLGDD